MSCAATRRSTSRARIADFGIPYVAFGGGEPLGVAHCWDIFERLAARGVALKLETDGSRIDDGAADRLARARRRLRADLGRRRDRGHARARASRIELRGGDRARSSAWSRASDPPAVRLRSDALQPSRDRRRLRSRGDARLQRVRHRPADAHRSRRRGDWDALACTDDEWQRAVAALHERARRRAPQVRRCRSIPGTSSTEMRDAARAVRRRCCSSCPTARSSCSTRCRSRRPTCAAIRCDDAWQAYRAAWRTTEVRDFVAALPRRAGAAAPRQRDLGPAPERLRATKILRSFQAQGRAVAADESCPPGPSATSAAATSSAMSRDRVVPAAGSAARPSAIITAQ